MNINDILISRRNLIKAMCAASAGTCLPHALWAKGRDVINRTIPVSGELLPVIGMGSSRTFDRVENRVVRTRLRSVLQAFFDNGGALIDSSPMYGAAESVIGDLLKTTTNKGALFAATKVWTDGKQAGIRQMEQSMLRMGVKLFDLMQIHNLWDWEVHIQTLKEWKEQGLVRYIGITTSHQLRHEEFERIMKIQTLDFVQFSYNIDNREAEKRLLPLAAERGTAVLVNRPFQRGALFQRTKASRLPKWSSEFDCATWAQFFLKFIVSHPAVTCVIPATSKVHHMVDNMTAGFGRMPDIAMRKRMIEYYESL